MKTTEIFEHTLSHIKITSDKERKIILHLIVLILKMFQHYMKGYPYKVKYRNQCKFWLACSETKCSKNVLNIASIFFFCFHY